MKSRVNGLVSSKILQRYHGSLLEVHKDQLLFVEADKAIAYFQIKTGSIKLYNLTADGQEFIQAILRSGESVGQAALLGKFAYEASASALEPSMVWHVPADYFLQMLADHHNLQVKIIQAMSEEVRFKSVMLRAIAFYAPEDRLQSLFHFLQSRFTASKDKPVVIPYTRQQLANMLRLRVETVIRTVKSMEKRGLLKIESDHKIIL
jgi:CRP/FNR family cyclic AMP-dependent transcriptional regulator